MPHNKPAAGLRRRTGKPASLLRRAAAFVLDLIVVAVYYFFSKRSWAYTIGFFALYHTVSSAVFGATLGKAALGLTVRKPNGRRLGWMAALLRSTVGYLASAFFLLGFLNAIRDARRRTWHDELFGSEVIQQSGALSLKRLIRALDRWLEQENAWQDKMLKRLKRLEGLFKLVMSATTVMTVLQHWIQGVLRRVENALKRSHGNTTSTGSRPALPSRTSVGPSHLNVVNAVVANHVTGLLLAGAAVISYQAVFPPLRPWNQTLPPPSAHQEISNLPTGDVEITLTWQGNADIDLAVTDPAKEAIDYTHRTAASGGRLDRDDHSNCSDPDRNWGAEHIYWGLGSAPRGAYKVQVKYYEECANSGATNWRVALVVDKKRTAFTGILKKQGDEHLVTEFSRH